MNSFYEHLKDRSEKRFALLVDPDKYDDDQLETLMGHINQNAPDLILAAVVHVTMYPYRFGPGLTHIYVEFVSEKAVQFRIPW